MHRRRGMFNRVLTRFGEPDEDPTSVIRLAFADDEPALLEPIENAAHSGRAEIDGFRQMARLHWPEAAELPEADDLRTAETSLGHELAAVEIYCSDYPPQRFENRFFPARNFGLASGDRVSFHTNTLCTNY